MFRNKHFKILSTILIIAVSFGFFFGLGDDRDRLSTSSYPVQFSNETDVIPGMTTGANMPTYSYHGGAFSFVRNDTGWVFCVGGDLTGSGVLTTKNDRYNVTTNTWTTMAPYPTAPGIWYTGGATLGSNGYICAGLTGGSLANVTAQCTRYDINANTWTIMAPMPAARAMVSVVSYQDSLIYVAGGFDGTGASQVNVYLYNSISNSWRSATSLPASRMGGAFGRSGDTLVYVNGTTGVFNGTVTNTTYVGVISQTDRATITWTTRAPYPGTGRYRQQAQNWGCRGIVISGGTSAAGYAPAVNECYVYSPGADVWTVQPTLITARTAHMTGSVKLANNVWKFINVCGFNVVNILTTDILTDTLICAPPALPPYCNCDVTTYVPTVGGTPGPSGDDITITYPIPFTFTHVGVPYTNISICTNGFAVLGTSTYASFVVDLCGTLAAQHPMLAPLWTDLNTATAGTITYITLGVTPNRIFVVQWANVGFFDGGAGRVSMQIRLYESSNQIQFHYGPGVTDPSPEDGAVGLTKSPGASGNISSLTPGAACPPGVSTTVCNNFVAYTTTNFPSGRRYIYNCITAIEPITNGIPHEYMLSQNYPNPFNPVTKISYALPKAGNVKLTVFDILGREVATLVNEYKKAGSYDLQFDASVWSSGIYLYRIESADFIDTKKMILIK